MLQDIKKKSRGVSPAFLFSEDELILKDKNSSPG